MLLRYLPRDSAYVQAVAGDAARWGHTEYLLAALIDQIAVGNFYTAVVASGRRLTDKPTPPTPLLRPGDKPAKPKGKLGGRRRYSTSQMRQILDDWDAGPGGDVETKEVK